MEEQVAIFCDADDFCKAYEEYCRNKLLMDKEEIVPKTKMTLSEIMTILIMYHLSGYLSICSMFYINERIFFADIMFYIGEICITLLAE